VREDAEGCFDLPITEAGQGVTPNLPCCHLDLVGDRTSPCRQEDRLGTPVARLLTSLDQACRLQVVEQPYDRRAVQRQRCGQILLSRWGGRAGDVDEGQPG